MTTRTDVIAAARKYVGREFSFAGRGKRIDCVGLPLLVARDLQVAGWERLWNDEECHAYPRVRAPGFLKAKLETFVQEGILVRVDTDRLAPGDMMLRWGGFGHDHHVSVLAGDGLMIEARNRSEARHRKGRVVETIITPLERRTIMAGYQFAGVT